MSVANIAIVNHTILLYQMRWLRIFLANCVDSQTHLN